MTSDIMIDAVAINLGDPGKNMFRRALILSRINTAQLRITRELMPAEMMTYSSITWTTQIREMLIEGTLVEEVYTGFLATDFLKEARLLWDGYVMRLGTIDDFDEYNTTSYSDPLKYYMRGVYIGLAPNAPGRAATARLDYIKKPTTLTDAVTTLDLPEVYHRAVELEATSMLSPDMKWKQLLELELNELRYFVNTTQDSISIIPPIY